MDMFIIVLSDSKSGLRAGGQPGVKVDHILGIPQRKSDN